MSKKKEHIIEDIYLDTGLDIKHNFTVPIVFDQALYPVTNAGSVKYVALSSVASNKSNVKGTLKLKFNDELSKAAYALYVYNASNHCNRISSAGLYMGGAETNGPEVVELYGGPSRNVDGLLSKGTIDNRRIITDSPAITVATLYQAIRDGNLYVGVNSEQYPSGFLRGQIYASY